MWKYFLYYLAIISIVAFCYTLHDKKLAKRRSRERVPELTLMVIGAFGGALTMFITMLVIRHKTKHKKFMIGLPLMILAHAVIVYLLTKFI